MGLNKIILRFLVLALLLPLVLPIIGTSIVRADPGWYNTNWQHRKKITVNSANVSADLNNFPVMVYLPADSDLAADAQDDGDDLLFTAADEVTKLSHEIESFNGTTGQLVAWVKIPSLSSTVNTDIYLYYDNASVSSQEDAANVWDSNFRMVQHLQETSGGTDAIVDSTSNSNNGTDTNGPTLGATGKINGAIGFDGSNDYISVSDDNSLDITGSITLEAWVKPVLDASHRRIVIKNYTSWGEPYYMYALWVTSGGLGFGTSNGAVRNWALNGTLTNNVWQHVAGTYNGTEKVWYINGVAVGTENYTQPIGANAEELWIGSALDATTRFNGPIDEVRISSTSRSADWILTSYNNQSNPAVFFSLSAEESAAPSAVGGSVYPVNKLALLVPWLLLITLLSLNIVNSSDRPGKGYRFG
ncbi:DUF2341 domain-containing protein [Chloroflexota bacterium]